MNAALTSHQLESLETALRKRLAELREELRAAAEASTDSRYQGSAGDVSDLKDAAFADMVANLNDAEAERDAAEIRDIDAALTRMHEGRYGLCIDCGDAITHSRLEAYPSASRCLACQETHERS